MPLEYYKLGKMNEKLRVTIQNAGEMKSNSMETIKLKHDVTGHAVKSSFNQ